MLKRRKKKRQQLYACYLLCSLSVKGKGRTYVGFTVNPRRRIRQHNGELTMGACSTRAFRPWDMVLVVYGFSNQGVYIIANTHKTGPRVRFAEVERTFSAATRWSSADLRQ